MTSIPLCGAPSNYGNRPNIAESYLVNYAENGSTSTTSIRHLNPRLYQSNSHNQAPQETAFTAGQSTRTRTADIGKKRNDISHSDGEVTNRNTGDNEHRGRSTRSEGDTSGRQVSSNLEGYASSRIVVGTSDRSSLLYSEKTRTSSPDDHKRSISSSTRRWLTRVPEEEMEFPPATHTSSDQPLHGTSSTGDGRREHRYYGSLSAGSGHAHEAGGSAARYVEGLLNDEEETSSIISEEEEWILDEALAKEGLYRGNYKRLITLYTLVPLSTVLAFIFLGLLPTLAYRNTSQSHFPYPPYLPFPLPEILTATALWSLSYLLRDFLYVTSLSITSLVPFPSHRFPSFIPVLTAVISAFLQSASTLFFRQLAIPILLIPQYSTEHLGLLSIPANASNFHKHEFPSWQDVAFRRVWWVALGWAAAEAVVGIKQGYESIGLYKDVLVDLKDNPESEREIVARATEGHTFSNKVHNNANTQRASTLPLSSASQLDSSITPTQRAWEDRTNALALSSNKHEVSITQTISPRDRQDSLSSFASSNNGTGERQPLLRLTTLDQGSGLQSTPDSDRLQVENEVERDLDELMALKSREELEEVYGMPVIRIPVFISCLHRINSILSSLGISLLLTAAYMRSTLAYHTVPNDIYPAIRALASLTLNHPLTPSNHLLAFTIPSLLILQTVLAMMHTPWILPTIGIHTFVYVGLLTSLGLFFSGLGVWGALT